MNGVNNPNNLRIDQFLTGCRPFDAVTEHALALQKLFGAYGESRLYAQHIHPELADAVSDYRSYDGAADLIYYHASIGSNVGAFVLTQETPLVLQYHNVTPPRFFEVWGNRLAVDLRRGLSQLDSLAPQAALSVTPSRFNAQDLVDRGATNVLVLPILLAEGFGSASWQPPKTDKIGSGANFLFVGRTAPNKRQDLLILAFAAYREMYDPHARLHLVGGEGDAAFEGELISLISKFGLWDAVDMPGMVDAQDLETYYRQADLFVCASEHEGFCVPLVEAMSYSLPIVASDHGAVRETLAGAGLAVPDVDPVTLAGIWHTVIGQPALKDKLVKAERKRFRDFQPAAVASQYRNLVPQLRDLCRIPALDG